MKAKDLIKILEQHPDFNVQFVFVDGMNVFPNIRHFPHIEVADIGHSDKVIVLTAGEQKHEISTKTYKPRRCKNE